MKPATSSTATAETPHGHQALSAYIRARFDEFSRSQKDVAQYIVDPSFEPVHCEGPFAKEALDPAWVAEEETRVTRGRRRLQEIPTLGISLMEYPLPEVRQPGAGPER